MKQNTYFVAPLEKEANVFDLHGRRKYLNTAERRAFLMEIKKEKDKACRAFCLTLYYTGCRISEALNLTAERVDLADKSLVFETLKQRQEGVFRAVPVPDSLADLFGKLLMGTDAKTRVWNFSRTTAYRIIKRRMKNAGISGKMSCPKGLRHAFGVACIVKKVPAPTIKSLMGHAYIETTCIYTEVMGDDARKLAALTW